MLNVAWEEQANGPEGAYWRNDQDNLSAVLQAQLALVQELYLMAQVQYTCAYLSLLYLYKYNKDK